MFGAYTLWVSHADGTHAQIAHGTPQYCLAEADRRNAELAAYAAAASRMHAEAEPVTSTRGIRQDAAPEEWRQHRFGLPAPRWAALAGRAVWITGAGTGYGRALSVALAAAGATVFLSGRRDAKLAETRAEMERLGASADRAVALPCDVTSAESVAAAAASIRARVPHLYGLVNNAALPRPPGGPFPLRDASPAQWSALLATNVTGPWLVTREILPHMVKGGALRSLFMSSEAGWAFTPGFGPYNVSKAALNNLGASFAAECAAAHPGADVQINVLVPGEARTEMNQGSAVSPYATVSMALALLSHPPGGPNGCFFHRDGRHLAFAYAPAYAHSLLDSAAPLPAHRGCAAPPSSAGRPHLFSFSQITRRLIGK